MKKRIFSVLLAVLIAFTALTPAFAQENTGVLRFDENGEFKILHLSDCQDFYPFEEQMMTYIDYVLRTYEPDLVVLGGDNSIGLKDTKELEIQQLVEPFVRNKIYFTLVFGNHDHEQGVDKETLLSYFQKYGGEYCLAYDAVPELHGTATHNLPVYASDSDSVKFNVWLMDSGSYVYEDNDESKKRLGYDCVNPDQIEWYKSVSKSLEEQEGAKVPSMVFQHMVVGEIYDAMFPAVPFSLSPLTENYNNGKYNNGKNYPIVCPDTSVFKGHLFEPPSPGYYNHGQYDAMLERGDVLAVYSGHDHLNTYEVEYKGIIIINTPGASYNAYGNQFVRGSRLITISEDSPEDFDTKLLTVNRLVYKDAEFASEMGISRFTGLFWSILGNWLLLLKNISAPGSFLLYLFN